MAAELSCCFPSLINKSISWWVMAVMGAGLDESRAGNRVQFFHQQGRLPSGSQLQAGQQGGAPEGLGALCSRFSSPVHPPQASKLPLPHHTAAAWNEGISISSVLKKQQ